MKLKKIKVMSSGVFDVLNLGHINILTQAKKLGDHLIVAIQDDESVKELKGKFPVLTIQERIDQISALPFVDEIVTYKSIDQRNLWSEIKPDVIVQGDDYIHSADRTDALKYLKENQIRLVLLPRTAGISSTEIKKRILESNRKDLSHLKNLKLIPIDELKIYEEFNENKVQKLIKKIKNENIFHSPITVGKIYETYIVTDGVNRLETLKRLGCKYVTALVLPYKDIDLTNNVHYLDNGKITRLSEFSNPKGKIIEFEKRTHNEIYELIKKGEMIPNGETWHKPPYHIVNFIVDLKELVDGVDLDKKIQDLINNNNIRYYQSNVYSCNEWR
jgi:rfaE bifunctional protein nucleotidyltransferase chain/domain